MGLFLDTGFFLGLVHPEDLNHKSSKKLLLKASSGKYGLLYTSPFVISEAATVILIRTGNNTSLMHDFHQLLFGDSPIARVLSWSTSLNSKSWRMFFSHNEKAKTKKEFLSFVDASNIVYCREYHIDRIAAFDGDFDPYLIRLRG